MNNPQKKQKADWKRRTLIIVCIVLAVILILIAGAAVYMNHLLGKITILGGDTTISAEDASSLAQDEYVTIDPNDTTPIYNPDDFDFDDDTDHEGQGEHIVNIMLVGQDAREGEGTQRSDAMILVTFNKSKKTITLTSFMRDSYVQIPGYGATKLCHAYQYGGMSLLNETIYNHYGIEIDGNVEVDFSSFADVIDELGGVEITLTKKEAKKMNEMEGYSLTAGTHLLTGDQALLYSRLRSIDSDYARTQRQRTVIMSLIEKYKDQSLSKMLSLLDEILPLVKTNIPKDEIVNYAVELFPMVSGAQLQSQRLPADGTYVDGYVAVFDIPGKYLSCQVDIDFEANRKLMAEIFAE